MRGSRVLFIIGAVLILGAAAVGAIFLLQGRGEEEPPKPEMVEEEGTPVPEEPVGIEIVVAAQDLSTGMQITEEMTEGDAPAVVLKVWPEDAMPDEAITQLDDVYDRTVRVDIPRGMPILSSMLGEGPAGSVASLRIPEGKVAYALPVARYSSVAWSLQPGDYVDVIISLLLVEIDEEFQSVEPNQARCLSPSEDPACAGMGGQMGRLEVLPNGWLVNLTPSESQRPRLVSQLTVQSAYVLRVGDWPTPGEKPSQPVEEPSDSEEGADTETTQQAEETTRPSVAPLTLAVTREEAMVLNYAQLMKAHITLVLRRAGDEDKITTEPVTLQYLMERFNIEMPTKLPYGVEPRITTLGTSKSLEASAYEQSNEGTTEE